MSEVSEIHLREARSEDARLLFEWANDPEVRQMAFSQEPITWEGHCQWFERRLADPDCWIFIAEAGEPIGQVRFNALDAGEAEIDVHTRPGQRGKGLGSQLIVAASKRLFQLSAFTSIRAVIKPENIRSVKAFEKAGYVEQGMIILHGLPCHLLRLERPEQPQ